MLQVMHPSTIYGIFRNKHVKLLIQIPEYIYIYIYKFICAFIYYINMYIIMIVVSQRSQVDWCRVRFDHGSKWLILNSHEQLTMKLILLIFFLFFFKKKWFTYCVGFAPDAKLKFHTQLHLLKMKIIRGHKCRRKNTKSS